MPGTGGVYAWKLLLCCLQMFDDADELKSKVQQLAAAVRQANHLVVYTGAGISTVGQTPPLFVFMASMSCNDTDDAFLFRQPPFQTTGVLMGCGPSCRKDGP